MIRKGQKIRCGKCGKHILTASTDIHFCTPMVSDRLNLPDGTPLPYQAEKRCQHCGAVYFSISTNGKTTIEG